MKRKQLLSRDTVISNGQFAIESGGVKKTYQIAKEFGQTIQQGDVLCLHGELGAGKTVFAKGIADALGVPSAWTQVLSPTFVLIREYIGRMKMIHVDLYRIQDCDELIHLGLNEYFYGTSVVLVEWAERCQDYLPKSSIHIYIDLLSPRKRRIRIERVVSDNIMS